MWNEMTKEETAAEFRAIDAEIAENERIGNMRDQAEKTIQAIAPDVVAVFVLPTECFSWVTDESEAFTAIAVVVPEKVEHESNITAEASGRGQALLDLCALYKFRSGL
jgi:hypothetical protein